MCEFAYRRAAKWVIASVSSFFSAARLPDAVLDILFGPEQDFEYVSTTTPVGPPKASQ